MELKAIPEKLFGPEFYMDIESKDVRLSVSKLNDFIDTLGDASLSLIYCDKKEHPGVEGRLLNIVRRIHIRHAIVDLNNAFDILLQVPWFLYRCWSEFNIGGKYCHPKHKAKDDIVRNTSEWVEKVENSCNYKNVIKFLIGLTDANLKKLALNFESFNNNFRFNTSKNVVVRKVANQLKHKHNLKLKEFNEPYSFNMIINGKEIKFKDNNLYPEIRVQFHDIETNIEHGQIIARYKDDLEVDIEYNTGEKFLGKDLINQRNLYAIDDLLNEMEDYFNNIVELYNQVYNAIKDEIQNNPFMKEPTIRNTIEYNMDNFFKSDG